MDTPLAIIAEIASVFSCSPIDAPSPLFQTTSHQWHRAEATIQVCDQPNPKFTTNHIAERAGVAVATLYRYFRYFPDRNALLRFLVMREADKLSMRVQTIIETANAPTGHTLVGEVVAESMTLFGSRPRSTHNLRTLIQQDKDLKADVDKIRVPSAQRLYERLRQIEPNCFSEITDAKLRAVVEAFKVATLALEEGSENRTVDLQARTTLAMALIESS